MRLAKLFLSVGIAVVFVVFIAYGLYVIYEPPKTNYYYGMPDESGCDEEFKCREMIKDCEPKAIPIPERVPEAKPVDMQEPILPPEKCQEIYQSEEYIQCNENLKQCRDEWKKTSPRTIHARNSMWILVVIGIATILVSLLFVKAEAIRSGLLGGGIMTMLWMLIYTQEYWVDYVSKYVKLSVLGVVLVILIYVGYKKIEQKLK